MIWSKYVVHAPVSQWAYKRIDHELHQGFGRKQQPNPHILLFQKLTVIFTPMLDSSASVDPWTSISA